MKKHALLTLAGIVLAVVVLAWVRPTTSGGATFIVVLAVAATNAVGAFLPLSGRPRPGGSKRKQPARKLHPPVRDN